MKSILMNIFFFAAVLASFTAYAKNDVDKQSDSSRIPVVSDSALLAGTWVLYSLDGPGTAWDKIPTLLLDVKAGAFNTSTRCKGMMGRFGLQGKSCVFDNEVITTKMGCTAVDHENRYLQMLLQVNGFSITPSTLELKTQNAVRLTFKRQGI